MSRIKYTTKMSEKKNKKIDLTMSTNMLISELNKMKKSGYNNVKWSAH